MFFRLPRDLSSTWLNVGSDCLQAIVLTYLHRKDYKKKTPDPVTVLKNLSQKPLEVPPHYTLSTFSCLDKHKVANPSSFLDLPYRVDF